VKQTPTTAELLFGLASGDDVIAVAEPQVYVPGPRSALVPAECPYDIPDVDSRGGQLLRVLGPPDFPGWSSEYSVELSYPPCHFCRKPVTEWNDRAVAITEEGLVWCHTLCRQAATGSKGMPTIATANTTRDMPDCRMCLLTWEEHYRPVTTIWDAYCDTEGLPDVVQYYRPAAPFRSRNWPYRLIIDSPWYTADGKVAYVEEVAA